MRAVAGALALIVAAVASAQSYGNGAASDGSGFEQSFENAVLSSGGPTWEVVCLQPGCLVGAAREETALPEISLSGSSTPEQRPKAVWIAVVTAATLLGSAYNSFTDGPNQKFHFTNEGFFGQSTYAGGNDKASHFVSYYIVGKLLSGVYEELDMPADRARLLGTAVSIFSGFVTELGDGRGKYGFSYEDLLFDTMGAVTQLGIAHYGLGDLVGFSAGLVPAPPVVCCPYGGIGKDYTREIYSGDLKIAGLADRVHFEPGPARFLLFSVSYSTKGYPYGDPVTRERQIGLFVGVNFVEILREAGVNKEKAWGRLLYFLFEVIRIPYTQIGYQFDLNHGRWHGPTIGDAYPGGW
jgi:Predicted periplasmic lipoprotein (DUF2279)